MGKELNFRDVIKKNLCVGCGLCSISGSIKCFGYNPRNDCYTPLVYDVLKKDCANQICPGKGYAIKTIGKELFGQETGYDLDLGFTNSMHAARANHSLVLENASSGGVITSVLLFLLDKGLVDKVSVTQFVCDQNGVSTKSFLTNDKKEIIKAQGSKYCPVNLSNLLNDLHETDERVAVMATPCAVAGIRQIIKKGNYIKADVKYLISNFCGGHKSYKNIKRLAEIFKIDYYNLKEFRFRGGGQPGSLRFVDVNGKVVESPYPLYVGLNGYSKMLRCHLCVDATGELADIACGDAWLDRFNKDLLPWSLVLCRNTKASDLIRYMESERWIMSQQVSIDEVKHSQRLNLASKKTRQKTRRMLYKLLGYQIPDFHEEGYSLKSTSLKTEIWVYTKHRLKLLSEKLGVYMNIYGYKKLKQ